MVDSVSSDQHGGFIPFKAVITQAKLWLGMASFLSWITIILCFEGSLRDEVEYAGGLVHDPVFYAACATATIMFGIHYFLRTNYPALSRRVLKRLSWGMALGIIATAVSTSEVVFNPEAPRMLSYVCGFGIGIGFWAFTILWAQLLTRRDLREVLVIVSVAMCTQWVVLVFIMLMPGYLRICCSVMLPAYSFFVLASELKWNPALPYEKLTKSYKQILRRMSTAIFLFAATIQFIWTFFIKMLTTNLSPSLFPLVFVLLTGITILIMGFGLIYMHRQKSYRIELYYRLAFLFCVVSAGSLPLAAYVPVVAYIGIYAGYSLIIPSLWMMALGFSYITKAPITLVMSLLAAAQYAGFFLGFVSVDLLRVTSFAGSGVEISAYVCTLVIFVFSVTYVWVFSERDVISMSPALFGLQTKSLQERCIELSEQFGLTKREGELLELFACGRNSGFIEKELFISKNTVASHRKSIYRKMGVKTQQELLSLVEGHN